MASACIASAGLITVRTHAASKTCCRQPRAFAVGHPLRSSSALQGQQLAAPARLSVRQGRAQGLTVHANAITDVGKYLSDAAKQIFSPTTSDVNWPEASNFAGNIVHHEDAPRLRRLYEVVKSARQQIQGCTDPNASNYQPGATEDDGTCTYGFSEESLGEYISGAVGSVFGSNFKGGENEPDWSGTTFNYSGQIVSQRDIQRLLHYENVVKKTLEKVEDGAKQ